MVVAQYPTKIMIVLESVELDISQMFQISPEVVAEVTLGDVHCSKDMAVQFICRTCINNGIVWKISRLIFYFLNICFKC